MDIDSLQDWRDVTLIAFTIAGTVLFLIAILFTVVLGFLSMGAVSRARGVLKDNVQPATEAVRDTAQSVRGTVTFISDYAVAPVVRVYSIYAGARRFIAVISRFTRSPGRAGKRAD